MAIVLGSRSALSRPRSNTWSMPRSAGVLFSDVMRQRGNQYREHLAADRAECARATRRNWSWTAAGSNGRSTTYWCASFRLRASRSIRRSGPSSSSIRAPDTVRASAASRPTARSASRFKAGHPCYFIGFLPDPMPGQTIEDIARAEAVFLEKVIALHPACRRQAVRDRQLPGRLGGHDAGRDAARTVRPDHHRRRAAVLLAGRARQISDAL